MRERSARVAWAAWLLATSMYCAAGGIDHRLDFDQSGIWQRRYQQGLLDALIVGEVGGALWEGSDSELGRTFWQAIDSSVIAGISSQGLKYAFTRARPIQANNPHLWFQGGSHYSFPSGEIAGVTSIVAPFMLEYGPRHPIAYALAALPMYDGVARMKSQAHWQTDVLASIALGTATAYYAHQRDSPVILGVLPHAFEVGFKASW